MHTGSKPGNQLHTVTKRIAHRTVPCPRIYSTRSFDCYHYIVYLLGKTVSERKT